VTINVNSNFVTNISISSKYSDYSPRRLEIEVKEKRLSNHTCDKRHSCPSSHICSFVSPRRNRVVARSSPYRTTRIVPISLRPAAVTKGVLISSRTRSLGRLRGPVRFNEPLENSRSSNSSSLYTLDEDLTTRMSAIQLGSIGCENGVTQSSSNNRLNSSLDVDSSNSSDSFDAATKDLSRNVSRLQLDNQSDNTSEQKIIDYYDGLDVFCG